MKRLVLGLLFFPFIALIVSLALAANCVTSLIPVPGENGGSDSCTYTHAAYDTFSYESEIVQATWSSGWEVTRAGIFKDWKFVTDYSPGLQVRVSRDPAASRYDFLLRLKDVVTQEEFLSITPIWCNEDGTWVDAPTEGCGGVNPSDCAVSESTTCADGSTVGVSCAGDSGTCEACGQAGQSACCRATTKTTTTSTTGEQTTTTTHVETTENCPDPE